MLDKLKHITTFIFDVDGVLTNGNILVNEAGEQLRQFNIKDGYALQLAVKKGYHVCIITGGTSIGVLMRLKGLGITDIFMGAHTKIENLNEYVHEKKLSKQEIVYVGDDIPDIEVMKNVGLAVCPEDSAEEIKSISHYISQKKGGYGVARDIIEKVLKVHGKWYDDKPDADDGSFLKW